MAFNVGAIRALVLDANFSAHGVPAVIELPNGDEVSATVIWVGTGPEGSPAGLQLQRREQIHVLAVRRSEVPELPRGSLITAAEPTGDGAEATWIVDGHERTEADQHRVTVIRHQTLNDDDG